MNWLKKQSPIYLCIIPLIVYILTASRTLPWGDGAEFYLAVRTLGIPHPSGYPLFVLIGRLFYLISASPFLLNLLPGIFTSITVLFLYLIISKMTKDRLISIILPLFFAFGREIWCQSVAAEIYTLNLLFMTIILYLLLRISENERFIPMIFFISGLALTNHLTALFYVIPVLIFVLLRKTKAIRYLPLTIIPLFLYLYFPIRAAANPALNLFNPVNTGRLINYVSGKAFHYRTLFFSGTYLVEQLTQSLNYWWQQFLILIPVGFYGIILIKDKKLKNMLIIILFIMFAYAVLYNIPDKQGYYLPLYGLWLVLIAIGLSNLVPTRFKIALIIFPLISVIMNYRICDLSSESSLDDLCTSIYDNLADHSIIISDDYFVYCGMFNRELNEQRQIKPVSQFYLRMEWYPPQLQRNFPNIIVPERVAHLLRACQEELATTSKDKYGDISKAYCHRIQYEILKANIDKVPIYFFIYDDAAWPRHWFDFYLESHGVFYQFLRDSVPPHDFAIKFPSPKKYQTDRLVNTDAITVAKKFAAAYNRRGIYRFQLRNTKGAIEDFKNALAYYPDYYQVHVNLGLVYLETGDTLKTLQSWRLYINHGEPGANLDRIRSWYNQLLKLYPE